MTPSILQTLHLPPRTSSKSTPARPDTTRVPLRRVFFLNGEKSLSPSDSTQRIWRSAKCTCKPHRTRQDFGGTLPALYEATYRGEHYTCKDGPFRLQSDGIHVTARMYRDKKCVSFKLADLRYIMNVLHFVQVQQNQYILAQIVMAFATEALGWLEFVERSHTATSIIPYDHYLTNSR